MKNLLIALPVALAMTACSSNSDDRPSPVICPTSGITLTRTEQALVASNNDFAFNLLRQATPQYAPNGPRSDEAEKNLILSPISITYALGMLNNGAAGETQQQINKVLGFQDAGQVNEFCRKMYHEAPRLDESTKVSIANNIYVNQGYELRPAFVEKVLSYYDAQPETRNFHDGQTMNVINQWASSHTNGMISKVLNEDTFNPDAVSYLLNATYFKGEWSRKFNKSQTHKQPFRGLTSVSQVEMMSQEARFSYTSDDDCKLLQLPYGNGAYCMTILLPNSQTATLAQLRAKLTSVYWQQLLRQCTTEDVVVQLPRFEAQTDTDLISYLSALGMSRAFDPYNAEFPDFCNRSTYIGMMKQVARIRVDEEGAEAAAVTTTGVCMTSIDYYRKSFIADHPFLYVISEQSTGAIFFIGQYTGN